jgi:phage regulator Rha-like protein
VRWCSSVLSVGVVPFEFSLADKSVCPAKVTHIMPTRNTELAAVELVEPLIREIRGERVILDADLARLYGVPAYRLNEAVKRNVERFPPDFRFQLTDREAESLRSQSAILKVGRGQHRKYLPYAFTEHGAIMAANVLNSPQAVQMSVFVVRAFVKMRGVLTDTRTLAKKLAELEADLKSRLDVHEVAIVEILQRLMDILDPPPQPEPPKRELGFHVKDERSPGSKGGRRR